MNNALVIRSFFVLFLNTLAWRAIGQSTVIDQEYDLTTPPPFVLDVVAWAPVGQEFTPTLGSLSFVDLFAYDDVGNGGVLSVNIHSQSIDGPLLGVSSLNPLPAGFLGITRFMFTSPVALTPGSLAVIEVTQGSSIGGQGIGVGIIPPSYPPYSGGHLISQGMPQANGGMWFREGVIVPEPLVTTLLFTGAALFTRRGSHSITR